MKQTKIDIGNSWEDYVSKYIVKGGYIIVDKNFYSQYGEIDIVAFKDGILVFFEVRYRSSGLISCIESLNYNKKIRLIKTANIYLSKNPTYQNNPIQFDFVAIGKTGKKYNLVHFKNCIQDS